MPAQPALFVVVDDNPDTRFLLARALTKTFPKSVVQECSDTQTALDRAGAAEVSAVVAHRTTEMTGLYFVQSLRKLSPRVPIVMVSGIDRSAGALAAGANKFLLFDQWRQIGSAVAELLGAASASSA